MSHVLLAYVRGAAAALMLVGAAGAQSASYGYFGAAANAGCGPFGLPVEHTALGTPQLGSTFTVALTAPSGDCSYNCLLWFLATGFSNTSFQGVPLPWTPGPLVSPIPGCGSLYVSLERIEPAVAAAGAAATVSLAIPANSNLVGLDFYQQPFAMQLLLGGVNNVALGRAGHGTIGF